MFQIAQIDAEIMNFVLAFRSEWLTKALLFFTYLGDWQVIICLSVVAIAVLLLLRKKRETVFLAAALISGLVIRLLSKPLFHRQRPDAVFSLISENGYSFPSGHSLMAVVFYGAIAYLIFKLCKKRWQKIISSVSFAALVLFISFSRVYLGVHWASDVAAGWLIGFIILAFFIRFFRRFEESV